MTATRPSGEHLRSTVRPAYPSAKRGSLASAALRLHYLYGDSPRSWETRLSGEASDFQRVGKAIRALRDVGLSDKIPELMIPIEAALAPTRPLSLTEAINAHNHSDACEDVAQAAYVRTTGDEELDAWLKRVAADLDRGNQLLACLEAERQRRREARQ